MRKFILLAVPCLQISFSHHLSSCSFFFLWEGSFYLHHLILANFFSSSFTLHCLFAAREFIMLATSFARRHSGCNNLSWNIFFSSSFNLQNLYKLNDDEKKRLLTTRGFIVLVAFLFNRHFACSMFLLSSFSFQYLFAVREFIPLATSFSHHCDCNTSLLGEVSFCFQPLILKHVFSHHHRDWNTSLLWEVSFCLQHLILKHLFLIIIAVEILLCHERIHFACNILSHIFFSFSFSCNTYFAVRRFVMLLTFLLIVI